VGRRLAFYSGYLRRAALALVLVALVAAPAARAAPLESLEIVTQKGVRVFQVELAVTSEERARGLMERRELPTGTGMLFDFGQPSMGAMWMKDTYISLDMMFIDASGTIVWIAEDTVPLSTALILSPLPVRGVLEVAAGTARRQGIATGDRVAHRIFTSR
jgi:uncharacterized membrane protein (UPF0127 family)